MPTTLVLPARSFAPLSARAAWLVVSLDGTAAGYLAGQAMKVGRAGQPLRKPYSVACSPERAAALDALEFVVGLDEAGSPGTHLADLGPGTLVELEGPVGRFTLPPLGRWEQCVLVGGGTGIAPLRAMWQQVLGAPPAPPVTVVYSARTAHDLVFADELDALSSSGLLEFVVTLTRETDPSQRGGRGRVSVSHLEPFVTPATLFAVCGPPAFVTHVEQTLAALDVAATQILKEDW